ncbi:class I SAM-dependent methyltransferase [Streptomyces polygonati]|uniref:Class I SAM-dependent methyltransferase n=1 Tax=Streptomyces polygonati TaxID=1617087 RepID=A0ABV8HZI7_9ACTN
MTHSAARPTLASQFDAFHAARARSGLVNHLYATAMGEAYPPEVADSSSCDWPLLGLMTSRLRMRPGQLLVDAGCGTGGTGLWLARALSARLVGIDLSPVAIEQAGARRAAFLPNGRATFRVASLDDTGLPDSCAHGIVCVDSLGFASNRRDAVRELGRVLAPGGRLLLTRALRQSAEPAWVEEASSAGLTVEHVAERPHEPAMWERLYRLWIDHADHLRRELGDPQAENMLREARNKLPSLPGRRAVLLTLRRPPEQTTPPSPTDTMTGLGRHPAATPTTSERTPQ